MQASRRADEPGRVLAGGIREAIVLERLLIEDCTACGASGAKVIYVQVDTGQGYWAFSRRVCGNSHCEFYDARAWASEGTVPSGPGPTETPADADATN